MRIEKEKELKALEEKRKAQMERELQGAFDEDDHVVEPEEEVNGRRSSGVSSLIAMSKFKTMSSLNKRKQPVAQMWDDTPHVYAMLKRPHVEVRTPGTPLDRHVRRKGGAGPPPGRCGACIGCASLLRCENGEGYKRAEEVIDIIR